MVGVGFLRSLWEKPIWEGVWPYLDPMDSVCVYAQRSWSGKCLESTGLTASSFFLIQKEQAIAPNNEIQPFHQC